LTNSLRVKCAVCPDFDLCLDCFRIGVEFKGHLSNHAYRIVDDLSFPIYHPEWGAEEELHLLEAIETYGLGNWIKVAEHIGRTPEVCRDHYFATYIDTDTFPLPKRAPELQDVDIGRLIEEQRTTGNRITAKRGKTSPAKTGGKGKGAADADEEKGELVRVKSEPMDGDVKAEEIDEQPEEDVAASSRAAGKGKGAAKKHHKNDPKSANPKVKAEGGGGGRAVPSLRGASNVGLHVQQQQQDGTTPGSSSLLPPGQAGKSPHSSSPAAKVIAGETVNTGYNIKRNEFDPEYDYEAETIISELDFKEGEPPEETARKVRLIEIYNRRLDERLKRRAFVLERGLVNVKARQAIDRKKGAAERDFVGRLRVLARYLPQEQFEELTDGMAVEAKLRSRIAELQLFRTMGLRTFLQTDEWESIEGKKRKEPSLPSQGQMGKSKLQRIPVDDAAVQAELAEMIHQPHAAMALGIARTTLLDGRGASGLAYWRARRGVALDITVLPDAESLSGPERLLCALERYLPAQYLAVKAAALEMQTKNGGVLKEDLLGLPFKVLPSRMERLFDFLVEHKCVTPLN
jgi:transcriptional adapter 2-alpha